MTTEPEYFPLPWDRARVQQLLQTSDRAVCRAILAVYRNQTQEEQTTGVTRLRNSVGFTGADARQLTTVAKLLLKGQKLHPRQIDFLRPRVMKYWRQLLEEIKRQEKKAHEVKYTSAEQLTMLENFK